MSLNVAAYEQTFSCETALRGKDYIHLLDSDGKMIAAFDGVTDFTAFTIEGGDWTEPTPEGDCFLAVVGDDGKVRKGTQRQCDMVGEEELQTALAEIQALIESYHPAEPEEEDYEQLINYTMTYDAGDECSEVSGGWGSFSIGSNASVTFGNNSIKVGDVTSGTPSTRKAHIGTEKTIDLSEYSKLHSLLKNFNGTSAGSPSVSVYTSETYQGDETTEKDVARLIYSGSVASELISADLTDFNNHYVCLRTYCVSVEIPYVFLTKPDNYQKLCELANVTAPSTLEELLADSTALTAIFNSEEAVKFMCKQCTGDFMVGVLNNETAVGLLKESPYLNMVVANPHWAKFMMMLPTANELLGYGMIYGGGTINDSLVGNIAYSDESVVDNNNATFANENGALHLYRTSTSGRWGGHFKSSKTIDLTPYKSQLVTAMYDTAETHNNGVYIYVGSNNITLRSYGTDNYPEKVKNIIHKELTSNKASCVGGMIQEYTSGVGHLYVYEWVLLKADNFQKWAEFGGVSADSLETLLADSTAMATLMSNQKAVDYLAGCTGDLMVSICNSEVAMSALCDNIAYDTLFKHPVWRKFMLMCPTSLSVMKNVADKIPTMTSNTEPSGKVSSELASRQDCYEAFNNDNVPYGFSVKNLSDGALPTWIGYQFPTPIIPFAFEGYIEHGWDSAGQGTGTFTMKLQGSNDGLTWEDVSSEVVWNDNGKRANYNGYAETDIQKSSPFFTNKAYTHYRFYIVSQTCTSTLYAPYVYVYCLQLYGKVVE